MTPERWQRVKELLQQTWDRDVSKRSGFLDEACVGEPELRSTVQLLLESDQNIGEFLGSPAIPLAGNSAFEHPIEDFAGRHIGPYQLVREIGHGGMGAVYLADRADGQYRKQVAIKLIRPGLGSDVILRRFRNERQVLADLDHPNIARLVDGGVTEDGLPWLVMDYVDGVPIDIWCQDHNLTVRDRLRLFRHVCAAVQYAHERHVIHRDIKPGNILVTAEGTARLLDFGIATVVSPESTAETPATTSGLGPMTPEYASPEQFQGQAIGPAADIYALGVVLYYLLTAQLPYEVQDLDPSRIWAREPVKPSAVAQNRQLAGELDSIVLKAIHKDPERRYESVSEFSEDLDCFLQALPIHAREASLLYRARKFATRQKAPVTAAAFTAVLLASLMAGLNRLYPSRPGKPLADSAAAEALNVGTALTASLEARQAFEDGLRMRAMFQLSTRKAFQRAIDHDPQFVMAQYHLAEWLAYTGDVPEARRIMASALELAERIPVPKLQKLLLQARQLRLDLRFDAAASLLEKAHREFPLQVEPLFELANVRSAEARFAEAATLYGKAVRIDERHVLAHRELAFHHALLGDLARSVVSMERYAALLPPGDFAPIASRGNICLITRNFSEAIDEYQKAGYETPVATAAIHAGDYALAERAPKEAESRGSDWFTASADLAVARGRLDDAIAHYEEAAKRHQPQGPLRSWFRLLTLTRLLLEQRRPEEVLALGQRNNTPWAAGLRGTAYLLLHREAEAEKEFATLRGSVAPMLGEYVADKTIELHRMQAAVYAGRSDQVIQMWPRLPRSFWSLYAFDVGRAYLQSGLPKEAEHHLRLARIAQLAYFWNTDLLAQRSFFTWIMAEFYLAEVMMQTQRREEAIEHYQTFLNVFEHSSARLPQIAAAKATLVPYQFSQRGKRLFYDHFSRYVLEPGWVVNAGVWKSGGGALTASAGPREGQAALRRHALEYRDAVFEMSFRLADASEIRLTFSNESGIVCGLSVTTEGIKLEAHPHERAGGLLTRIEPGKWHTVVIELNGKRMLARLDGHQTKKAVGSRRQLDLGKTDFALSVGGGSASFQYLRVYEVPRGWDPDGTTTPW